MSRRAARIPALHCRDRATARARHPDSDATLWPVEEVGPSRASARTWIGATATLGIALLVPVAVSAAPTVGEIPTAASAASPADRIGTIPPSTTTTTSTTTTVVTRGSMLFPMEPTPRCDILDSFGDVRSGHAHQGVDILATRGQKVYAVADGKLTSQYREPDDHLAGNGWRLTLPDRTYYFYAHLSEFAPGLTVGSTVRKGDLLGYVGDTGNPGPGNYHLHFEYHPHGGAAVDPLELFDIPPGCTVT
jgi:peptidoglycan LD-endopeptidase LytH